MAAGIHIFEEFVFPGDFAEWYRRYRPGIAKSITSRFLVIINIALLILCFDVGAVLWLTTCALLASNGVWHLVGAWKSHSYSPGVVTGVLLYVPLAIYGYVLFVGSRQVSIAMALAALAIGGSYHWWSSAFHRIRSEKPGPEARLLPSLPYICE